MTSQPTRAGTVGPQPARLCRPYGATTKHNTTKVTTASAISRNTNQRYGPGAGMIASLSERPADHGGPNGGAGFTGAPPRPDPWWWWPSRSDARRYAAAGSATPRS